MHQVPNLTSFEAVGYRDTTYCTPNYDFTHLHILFGRAYFVLLQKFRKERVVWISRHKGEFPNNRFCPGSFVAPSLIPPYNLYWEEKVGNYTPTSFKTYYYMLSQRTIDFLMEPAIMPCLAMDRQDGRDQTAAEDETNTP